MLTRGKERSERRFILRQENSEIRKLRLPQLAQVGVVVKDLEKVVAYYTSTFGIGPFDIYDFHP